MLEKLSLRGTSQGEDLVNRECLKTANAGFSYSPHGGEESNRIICCNGHQGCSMGGKEKEKEFEPHHRFLVLFSVMSQSLSES